MRHYASSRFWQCFNKLPDDIQEIARKNYRLLKERPDHSSLHFKRIRDSLYYSVRIGLHYRALGVVVPDGVQWFWVGTHAEYDQIIS